MGKKRGKDKSSREDEDFDLTGKVLYHHITQGSQRWLWFIKTYVSFLGPSCRHIKKGSEQNLLKKLAGNSDWTICQDCKQEENKENTNTSLPEASEDQEETAEIWMCLKCGHRVSLYYQFIIHSLTLYNVVFVFDHLKLFFKACGRISENQHAIEHYETPRSEPHCLVISLDSWRVWWVCCCGEQTKRHNYSCSCFFIQYFLSTPQVLYMWRRSPLLQNRSVGSTCEQPKKESHIRRSHRETTDKYVPQSCSASLRTFPVEITCSDNHVHSDSSDFHLII